MDSVFNRLLAKELFQKLNVQEVTDVADVPESPPSMWDHLGNFAMGIAMGRIMDSGDPWGAQMRRSQEFLDELQTVYDRTREQGNGAAWSAYVAGGTALARRLGVENFSYLWDGTDPVTGEEYGWAERQMYGAIGATELIMIGLGGAKGLVGKGPKAGAGASRKSNMPGCFTEGTQVVVGQELTDDNVFV